MKDKKGLFKITRILTEGIVDGKRESVKASEIFKKKTTKELFNKMDSIRNETDNNLRNPKVADYVQNKNKGEFKCTYVELGRNIGHSAAEKSTIFNKDVLPDLWNSEDWNAYHTRLREVSAMVIDKKGWPGFSATFMISAKDGDGVADIKVQIL